MMTEPIKLDGIEIPPHWVELCGRVPTKWCDEWYSGQGCILYAVSSTGGLTRGGRRPQHHGSREPMTDHEWYISIWSVLSGDLAYAARAAEKGLNGPDDADDAKELRAFEAWADELIETMCEQWGVEL